MIYKHENNLYWILKENNFKSRFFVLSSTEMVLQDEVISRGGPANCEVSATTKRLRDLSWTTQEKYMHRQSVRGGLYTEYDGIHQPSK